MIDRLRLLPLLMLLAASTCPVLSAAAEQAGSEAGQTEPAATAVPPDPRRLGADWWNWFQTDGSINAGRVTAAMELLSEVVGQTDDPVAAGNLTALRGSLNALTEIESTTPAVPGPDLVLADSYTLSQLIELESQRLDLAESVALEQGDAERLATAARAQRKRQDTRFTAYLALPGDDPGRLAEGLGVMAGRAALTVSSTLANRAEAELVLRRASLKAVEDAVETATGRLKVSSDSLATLAPRIETAAAELTNTATALRAAEDRISVNLAGNPAGRADNRLRTQQVVYAAVDNARAQSDLYRLNAQRDWIALRTNAANTVPAEIREATNTRSTYLRQVADQTGQWRAATERELLNMNELSSADRSIADLTRKRLGVAQETLLALEGLRRSTAELNLVNGLVESVISERLGLIERGVSVSYDETKRWLALVAGWLGASLFHIGETPVTTLGLLRLLLILIVALWISRLLRSGLNRFARTRAAQNQAAFYTIGRLAHYLIIVIGLMVGLSSIGLSFGNLALVAGALSVGVGFGLQSIVNNFVSGLIILFERSIKVGDFIELDSGLFGSVREINVRSTLINTNDNIDIVVPNSEFVSARLTNWTLREADRRIHIPFGVAYGTDKDLVRKAVLEAARKVPHTLTKPKNKEPQVWLVNFGDSSLDFELVVWLGSEAVRRPSAVSAEYTWEIESALTAAGIEIPFPQRDLHLRSGFEAATSDTN